MIINGAFENNKMINLLIGLLNRDRSGWNQSGSKSIKGDFQQRDLICIHYNKKKVMKSLFY